MSATSSRKARAERELTAQPKSIDAEFSRRRRRDGGVSVSSDQLASRSLAGATEQSDLDVATDATPELDVTSAPPQHEPLTGPTFDSDRGLWETTLVLSFRERPELWSAADGGAILGAFDDDERWKEVARTGRAL